MLVTYACHLATAWVLACVPALRASLLRCVCRDRRVCNFFFVRSFLGFLLFCSVTRARLRSGVVMDSRSALSAAKKVWPVSMAR